MPTSPEMFGRSTLLEHGWTDTLINRFLPNPDRLALNPHYRSGPQLKLFGENFTAAMPDSDLSFLERITVNYLRHQLTPYEKHLDDLHGQVGSPKGRPKIKTKVLAAIAAAYPWLADECERQNGRLKSGAGG